MSQNFDNTTPHHSVHICDRNSVALDGVTNVISFDENVVLLQTNLGELQIDGETLSVSHLSVGDGKIEINGKIYSLLYCDNQSKKHKLFSKK